MLRGDLEGDSAQRVMQLMHKEKLVQKIFNQIFDKID